MAAFSYTRANIRTLIRDLLDELIASFFTDADLNSYIDEAIKDIAEKGGCYQVIDSANTATLTRLVAFTGYKCIAVEYDSAGLSLIKINPVQTGHNKYDGPYPQFWFEWGNNIGIDPIPPGVYAMNLYIADTPTALSGESSTPDIPYAFCHLIENYSIARALKKDRQPEAAAMMMAIYENELAYMVVDIIPNIPDSKYDLRINDGA
jgi:hypothetical protein